MREIRTLLCPVDLSPLSERALELSVALAKRLGSRVILEHNLDARPPGYLGVSWMWSMEHEGREREKAERGESAVRKLLAGIPKSLAPEARVTRGPVAPTLLHLARELPADLIVMATHGRSTAEHRSVTEQIVMEAECPVLTVGESYRPEPVLNALGGERPDRLAAVVAIDFTPQAEAALELAGDTAARLGHRLVLVHALRPDRASNSEVVACREALSALVSGELADRSTCEVRVGSPEAAIQEAVHEHQAAFVVMAAHGKGALSRMISGSTTLEVLCEARCPVLFLPPQMVHSPARRRG